MIDIDFKYDQLMKFINNKISFTPDITLVLGSGLGSFSDELNSMLTIPTSSLPGYPESTIAGHKGIINFAEYNGINVLIFQGRIHFYEGYSLSQCILPVHIAHQLGCKRIILTNAAGGINPIFFSR